METVGVTVVHHSPFQLTRVTTRITRNNDKILFQCILKLYVYRIYYCFYTGFLSVTQKVLTVRQRSCTRRFYFDWSRFSRRIRNLHMNS